ncbi:hypothetical protein ID855_11620 [Xenorhabdus sp. ZM]|uniref:hypothetical protein n=1 Tax=Xenorhabdus szentirmaii TaxID=290112 RepID=UPI0019C8EA88|nr:hypothetical protein [Xenorhabdus sp. ZM]MBD2805325.1 hypothetical protein [Xenorhabdus sp. ZM]
MSSLWPELASWYYLLNFKVNGEMVYYPFLCESSEREINSEEIGTMKYAISGNEIYLTYKSENVEFEAGDKPDYIVTEITKTTMQSFELTQEEPDDNQYSRASFQKVNKIEPLCPEDLKKMH